MRNEKKMELTAPDGANGKVTVFPRGNTLFVDILNLISFLKTVLNGRGRGEEVKGFLRFPSFIQLRISSQKIEFLPYFWTSSRIYDPFIIGRISSKFVVQFFSLRFLYDKVPTPALRAQFFFTSSSRKIPENPKFFLKSNFPAVCITFVKSNTQVWLYVGRAISIFTALKMSKGTKEPFFLCFWVSRGSRDSPNPFLPPKGAS